MKNATKVLHALVALHKALGESWSTEVRNDGAGPYVSLQATSEREHLKLAGYFALTPAWKQNPGSKGQPASTETLHSDGVVDGIRVCIFAPSRPIKTAKKPIAGDVKLTPELAGAIAVADEAVQS